MCSVEVDVGPGYPDAGCRGLQVIAPAVLTQDQLWRLFDLVPGLDYCHLKSDPRSRMVGLLFWSNQLLILGVLLKSCSICSHCIA